MSTPLAIVGTGKMGSLVEALAPDCGLEVRARFDLGNIATLSRESLNGAGVAIEFTAPAVAPENLCRLAALGVNTVCGTTGWYDHLPEVRSAVASAGSALVYAPNFSIGVNLFIETVARAAALFAQHPEYEAWGWEIHHSKERCALRHSEETRRRDARRGVCWLAYAQRQSRRRSYRHARNRIRFAGGHHHLAPHGAEPGRICPWRSARRAMDRRKEGRLRVSRNPERTRTPQRVIGCTVIASRCARFFERAFGDVANF